MEKAKSIAKSKSWKFPKKYFEYKKQILIKDTNVVGNVYFSNYIQWHGEVRESFFNKHPLALEFMQKNPHIVFVTAEVHHHFIENSYLGDKLVIRCNSRDIYKSSFKLVFKFYNEKNNKKIGEGWQKICFLDSSLKSPTAIPQIILDLIEPVKEVQEL